MNHCVFLAFAWLALNLAAAFLVWVDKKRAGSAEGRRHRVRESNFHLLGLMGAGPGLLAAMSRVRHKTRKPRFLVPLSVYSLVGLALWGGLFWGLGCLPF